MTVCIDTNTVLQASKHGHPLAPILDAWVEGYLAWAVSNDILLEYEEVLTRQSGAARWQQLCRIMDLAELTTGNLLRVSPSFHFHIVTADADDNIFTDCAIAAEAEWLITDGAHFAPLAGAGYKPQPVTPQDFIARFLQAQR